MLFNRPTSRRVEIRNKRPDTPGVNWQDLRASGGLASIAIAVGFGVLAIGIMLLRDEVVPYRPGQFVPHDIVSRVDFVYKDRTRLAQARTDAREREPRIYAPNGDVWTELGDQLKSLPSRVANAKLDELPPPLNTELDAGTLTALQQYSGTSQGRANFEKAVDDYIYGLRELNLIILLPQERADDLKRHADIEPYGLKNIDAETLPADATEELRTRLYNKANVFLLALRPKMVAISLAWLKPTHVLDSVATAEAKNRAAERVPSSAAEIVKKANQPLVIKSEQPIIRESDWLLLKAENDAFNRNLDRLQIKKRLGLAGLVVLVTVVLAGYIARFQQRIVRNHARAIAMAALMLAMLLVPVLAGMGSSPLHFFGILPTLLVAMILAIAYDQRFAMGVSSMHAILVTAALGQGVEFFLILWIGILTTCFLLDDIRTRSKLIEVGGLTALAMIAAAAAAGAVTLDPLDLLSRNCLYTGAAGLTAGFVVLGILPFIEKAFRITTSMTLLELADASMPLLRRLAIEAPGTYNHSLQVATLAEAAAEAIHANSLLCRVGSYYHDCGKINKAEYFVENQMDGENRHINLSPSVSLLIIIGHVKDGIELAREYHLPTSLFPFIQQHHGTTLVEYFYHQACKDQRVQDQPAVSETQYRYPGPKPKSKEVAVVMLADCAESSCRAMPEPTSSRIETLVHDLAMKRLLDGQFDECDLTMKELELIQRSLVKSLLGIYHGRIQYPSTATPAPAPTMPVAKTA
jgi:putative nucleotidyltransferase with HDIG domain